MPDPPRGLPKVGAGGQGTSVSVCNAQAKIPNLPSAAAFPAAHARDVRNSSGLLKESSAAAAAAAAASPSRHSASSASSPGSGTGTVSSYGPESAHHPRAPGKGCVLPSPTSSLLHPGRGAAARTGTAGLHGRIKRRLPTPP